MSQLEGCVRDYLASVEGLNEASEHFDNACDNLRTLLVDAPAVVTTVDGRGYMATVDEDGDLLVKEVKEVTV